MIRQFYPRHCMLFILAVFVLSWINAWVYLYAKPTPISSPIALKPLQEWICITARSQSFNGGNLYIVVMTRSGGVVYRDSLDLATVTYDFSQYKGDRSKFNILKEFFNIETITPAQIAELFGHNAVVTYSYIYNIGTRIIHTAQALSEEFVSGRVKQNIVTIRLTD